MRVRERYVSDSRVGVIPQVAGKVVEHQGTVDVEIFNARYPSKRRKVTRKNFAFESYENYGVPLDNSAVVLIHNQSNDYISPEHDWIPPVKSFMPLDASPTLEGIPAGMSIDAGSAAPENMSPTQSGESIRAVAARSYTNLQCIDLTDTPKDVHALSLLMLKGNPAVYRGFNPAFNPNIVIPEIKGYSKVNASRIVPDISRLDKFSDGGLYEISFKNNIIARDLSQPNVVDTVNITPADMIALHTDFATAAFCMPSNHHVYILGYSTERSATTLCVKKYDSPETMQFMQSWDIDTGTETAASLFSAFTGRFCRSLCEEANGEVHLFGARYRCV